MEGPILFWGYKEQESKLILPEHDDDDDDDDIYIYIYDISSLRVNTSAHYSGRKQVKG